MTAVPPSPIPSALELSQPLLPPCVRAPLPSLPPCLCGCRGCCTPVASLTPASPAPPVPSSSVSPTCDHSPFPSRSQSSLIPKSRLCPVPAPCARGLLSGPFLGPAHPQLWTGVFMKAPHHSWTRCCRSRGRVRPISALVEAGSFEEWTQKSWTQTPALPALAGGPRAIACCLWASVFLAAGGGEAPGAAEQIRVRAR